MNTRFQIVDGLPLGITHVDIMSAFRPFFCMGATSVEGMRQLRIIRWNAAKRAAHRVFGGSGDSGARSKRVIAGEYEGAWARGFAAYDLSAGCQKPEPWVDRGQTFFADRAGVPRFRNVILGAVIRALNPRRVLEVGCGNGINLLLLAGQFPNVSFAGLELTESGNRVARAIQREDTLPSALALYPVASPIDSQAFRRIDFIRGDATAMPFGDGEFDLVITVLSVEQMERVRDKALGEIARVSAQHVLNMEPFAEANRYFLRRLHVFGRDYFRGAIADLPRYGLWPLWATMDLPQEPQLGAALVLSRKEHV